MSELDTLFAGAAAQAQKIASGEISARELTDAYLRRIAAVDEKIGAYLLVDQEGARAQADLIDAARAKGQSLGPLAGVPIAVKDMLVTQGLETTAASKILKGWVPPYDGTAIGKLRAAGAVLLGKLNMDEFAMGSSSENSAFAPCRNPWDLSRVPGGSSGGSSAAVAAGLCAASLGTDTGGSIRQPASFCGVVGIKPTYGRVSRYGVIAFASSLDQVGPLTRTVADAALMLEVIAGFDPLDSTSIDRDVPEYRSVLGQSVRGLTLGIPKEYVGDGVDPQVAGAVQAAIDVLREAGASIVPVSLPHVKYALPVYYLLAPAEASSNLARYDGIRYGHRAAGNDLSLLDVYKQSRGQGFGPEVKRRIMLGTFALRSGYYDAYYRKAQQVRTLIKGDFDRAFESIDAIVSPTSPTAAFRIGERTASPVEMYMADVFTLSANLAGLPGMSVPCGFTKEGLPVGLQLLGKPLDESTILKIAAAYERETGHMNRRPEV